MLKRFNRQYFDLLWVITYKEFTARYKQAIFGLLWIVLNPLLQMLVIGTIFSYFVKIPNYFIYLFAGLLPWQFFSLSLSKTTSCFIYERFMLQKSSFPREIIPLSLIISNMINLLLSIILFIFALQIIHPQSIQIILLLIGLIWIFIFTIGISLITSSLNVRFRDIAFFTQTATLLWFYATPIIYSLSQLPTQLQSFISINPLTAPIMLIQASLLNQSLPTPNVISINLIITIITTIIGVITFKKQSPYFVDWL